MLYRAPAYPRQPFRKAIHVTLARPYLDQLFEVIDDGYCLCEMLRGPDGAPLDYRFLETNPLFETMTGLVGAEEPDDEA